MQSLWMLLASFLFSIMSVCVKLASQFYPTSIVVMIRGIIGVILMVGIMRIRNISILTTLPWHHLWRGLVGAAALWLWFYTIHLLPLTTAVTLNYTSPIWIAAILVAMNFIYYKKPIQWRIIGAIMASFIGVILLLQPSIHSSEWFGGGLALLSGALAALAYLQVIKLGKIGEPEERIVLYFSLISAIAGLLGALTSQPKILMTDFSLLAIHQKWWGMLLLLIIGLSATTAQLAMTRAYRLGNTLVTANLQYTGIVFSSIWGLILWQDTPNAIGSIGILIILTSGILATYYNQQQLSSLK